MTNSMEMLKIKAHSEEDRPLAYLVERRRFPRVCLDTPLPAQLGRAEGTVVDVSARGARIHHSSAIPCGGTIRLTMIVGVTQYRAMAKVISCRLVSFGKASSQPVFESRLRLVEVPHTCEHLLAHLLRVPAEAAPNGLLNRETSQPTAVNMVQRTPAVVV
jgi:hypothetical protein